MSIFSYILSTVNPANNPEFMVAQLKNPHGFFANKVALKMNESNKQLYNMVLDNMCSSDGDEMLEIGFGNGKYFKDFISKASNIKMYGVEFSKSMVQQATKINAAIIRGKKLQIQLVKTEVLPFGQNSFNAVIAVNLIYFWENPHANLKEIYRVLQPGGRLYIGLRPAEILCKMPFAQYGFHLRTEAEWVKTIEQEQFYFIHSQLCKDQNIIVNKKNYPMQAQCMVFEK